MNAELYYNYTWKDLPDAWIPRTLREFLDNGVNRFVFTCTLVQKCLDEPEFRKYLRQLCRDLDISFSGMHAPYGPNDDLNTPDPARRPELIKLHSAALELAAEFGCRTYTIHIGAHAYCTLRRPLSELRKLAFESLEQLIPVAERTGVVIAVENSFEKTNSAREVLDLVTPFTSSPAVGVCYDTGHAHIMSPYPWKKREDYAPYMHHNWWEEGIIEEAGALELLRDLIVTTHIHDNTGYSDLHAMPGDGTIDWHKLLPKLRNLPRLLEHQTEVNLKDGVNWAGLSPAPAGGYSIRRLADTFRKLEL